MIRKLLLSLFLFLMAACEGDRLTFHQAGNATVNEKFICITSSPGDILGYYSLNSSENNYNVPLAFEDNIARKYPDTCLHFTLKNSTKYELTYEMNGEKYRFEFVTDSHYKVKKKYFKS